MFGITPCTGASLPLAVAGEGPGGHRHSSFHASIFREMLGVQRTSSHTLQSCRSDQVCRGKIQILNAEALQDGACDCYDTVKRHYERLLGPGK